MLEAPAMSNYLKEYVRLQAALKQEREDLENRLKDIEKALAGKLSAPAKKTAAKKTRKKRKKASAATIAKMKAAAKKRWAIRKKKPAKKKK